MHGLDRRDGFIHAIGVNRHFHFVFRLGADFTDAAKVGVRSRQRTPASGHRAVGQAAVIVPDVPGIHSLQDAPKRYKVRFRDKNFQFAVCKIHDNLFLLTPKSEWSTQIGEDFFGVGVWLGLRHDLLDHTLLVDEISRAYHAHADLAVTLLLLPDAIGFDRQTLRVGEQNKRQVIPE